MTFVIGSACIDVMDQSCIEVCPVDCIYGEDSDRMCFIDADVCTDCAVCEAACPVGAIFKDTDLPVEEAEYLAINGNWFTARDAARRRVDELAQDT